MTTELPDGRGQSGIVLGLKANWRQFALLVLINAFVGGMVGIERTVVPLIGSQEFVAEALDAAQDAVGGGGRYDGLAEDLGAPATPGVGFALGVDRTLLACDAEGVFDAPTSVIDVFVVDTTGGERAVVLTDDLRRAGLRADRAWDGRSMKAQMKAADRSGAAMAVIVGEDELAAGTVAVRDLRGDGGQETVALDSMIDTLRARLR